MTKAQNQEWLNEIARRQLALENYAAEQARMDIEFSGGLNTIPERHRETIKEAFIQYARTAAGRTYIKMKDNGWRKDPACSGIIYS